MNFNRHSDLEGAHAFLSASKYHWVNDDEDKMAERFSRHQAKLRGTRLHDLAHQLIQEKIKLPRTSKTLNMYVNDAIGLKMKSEQVLFYSYNCFGTADTIDYKEREKLLRIHDLKTGESKVSFNQLEVYTGIFCLEYDVNPNDIDIELRIYQNDEVVIHHPDKERILYIMAKIVAFDKQINRMKMEG